MTLPDDAIHVWTVPLVKACAAVDLPPDETAWTEAAVDPETRRRRAAARTALRVLLGSYLDRAPASLTFRREAGGKPRLAGNELSFNLSHADEVMLVALAARREVGIDIDRLDRLGADWQGVARLSFSAEEQSALFSLPQTGRSREAMRLWVRKEAYTKALGGGFAHGFSTLAVGITARPAASRISPGWSLIDLPVAAPMAASLAYAGDYASLSYRDFE